ncbi:DUF4240 domain-containing protein [Kitasatospora sp. NPDC094015]|uniref:DUF4240 domain-containing protein n=1 Tax=Kitasatospora sp. NPDC094015 TaxID=3155205 RepID=UPI00331D3949
MDRDEFWQLIEQARDSVPDRADDEAVAERAAELLAARPREEIAAADRVLWELMADSYLDPLWAAAYLINGGCSDDGFDYFRGWLILQGRETFEQALREPDTLAQLPAVREAAAEEEVLECEATLAIAWDAHLAATGAELPDDAGTAERPEPEPSGALDFDDDAQLAALLPRLAGLYG